MLITLSLKVLAHHLRVVVSGEHYLEMWKCAHKGWNTRHFQENSTFGSFPAKIVVVQVVQVTNVKAAEAFALKGCQEEHGCQVENHTTHQGSLNLQAQQLNCHWDRQVLFRLSKTKRMCAIGIYIWQKRLNCFGYNALLLTSKLLYIEWAPQNQTARNCHHPMHQEGDQKVEDSICELPKRHNIGKLLQHGRLECPVHVQTIQL